MTTAPEPTGAVDDWRIYRGDGEPHEGIRRLPSPPPWRRFSSEYSAEGRRLGDLERGKSYRPDESVVDMV
ncbi:MAG: AAA family ATPase, partial [Actinomadura sp.]